MSTRKFATVINTVIILVSVAAGVIAGLTVASNSGSAAPKAPQLKTADYNDGWTDGQADLADILGHRMPSAGEEGILIKAEAAGKKCHLNWTGATYVVSCA